MNSQKFRTKDTSQLLISGGCFLSVPIIIAAGFKILLGYAKKKEHQFSHQVEEVELEGEAASHLEDGLTSKEAVERFVKKLERITSQYEKMGARFSPSEFDNEKKRLESLRVRLATNPDAESAPLLEKANQLLLRFAPN